MPFDAVGDRRLAPTGSHILIGECGPYAHPETKGGEIRRWLKRHLGDQWQSRAHRLSRVRWVTKYRLLRRHHASVRRNLGYLLWDPEVGNFSYRVANVTELLSAIADATKAPLATLEGFVREADTDPELHARLARRLRWRFDLKHRPGIGQRIGWYVLIRAVRPSLVCETGTYDGLGALVLLRALARNRAEGSSGELLSFDRSAESGSYVDRTRYPEWRLVLGLTAETLEPAVNGRPVGALFHDTDHTEANQRFEFGVALRRPDLPLVLVDCSGAGTPTLERMTAEHGGVYRQVPITAADHWYTPPPFAFAVFGAVND